MKYSGGYLSGYFLSTRSLYSGSVLTPALTCTICNITRTICYIKFDWSLIIVSLYILCNNDRRQIHIIICIRYFETVPLVNLSR